MVKKHVVGVLISCALATAAWAGTSSPSLIATPPQPAWSELTVQQKIVLAPLSDDWDSLEYYRQKKWLGIAGRFATMAPEEQRRVQGQMQLWGKLTAEQRQLARENYKTARQLPTEKKLQLKQKWEEYLNLPEEERQKLKEQAVQAASRPVPKPGRPVTGNPLPSPPGTAKNAPASLPPAVVSPVPGTVAPSPERSTAPSPPQ